MARSPRFLLALSVAAALGITTVLAAPPPLSEPEAAVLDTSIALIAGLESTTTTYEAPATTGATIPASEFTTTTEYEPVTTSGSGSTATDGSPPPSSTTTTAATTSGDYDAAAEKAFLGLINDLRVSNGLPALTRESGLNSHARGWSKEMSRRGELGHSNIASLVPPWSTVGENVAVASSVSQAFDLLADSSGHRSNMLNPDFTHVGIGVWADGDGTLWITHVFAG